MIESKDISVVVQGAIDSKNTPLCLKSIRKVLPKATIILSTWEDSDIKNLDYDRILLNQDPGGFKDRNSNFTNNLLRQLVSTQNALKIVDTMYTLKIRTDILLKSAKFLKYINEFNDCNSEYKIYNEKIITTSFFTKRFLCDKKGKYFMPVPFHVSDWFSFGLSKDIRNIFSIRLPDEPLQSEYFYNQKLDFDSLNLLGCSHQYCPEQYITYHSYQNFSKNPVKFENYLDYDNLNTTESELYILNNFKIFSPQELDFICLKNNTNSDFYRVWCKNPFSVPYILWNGLYRPYIYRILYKRYCDKNYTIPLRIKFNEALEKIIIARGKKCITY